MARPGPFRRCLSALLAVSLAAGSVAPSAAAAQQAQAPAAWQPNEDDMLLLEVRLGQYRLADDLRGYRTPSGACLILEDLVKALDVPVSIDAAAGKAAGWAFEEANRIEIDRTSGKVRHRERVSPLSAASIRDTPEGWCADAAELSAWLGVAIEPDLPNAMLFVRSDSKLPVELTEERKLRAARIRPAPQAAHAPSIQLPYESWRMPSLDAVVTVGGISDERRGARLDARYELYASGEIAKVSVDARLSSDKRGVPDSLRMRAYRTDPEGKLLGPLGATHAAAGDVAGFSSPLVSQSVPGRGAVVTNRPVDRPDSFDRTTLIGELPNGWDAELYRNGQLLALAQDRRDGRYEFVDVQLLYGLNRLEVVLYGPQGQVRRRTEMVSVGPESIASGKTYYWAGVSQDNRDLVNLSERHEGEGSGWRATAGVEHGLDAKTSITAQVHSLVLADERLTYVEGAVRRSVGPALVEVSGAYATGGGMAARALLLAELGKTYVSLESNLSRGGFRSDRIEPDVTGRHILSLDRPFTLGRTILPAHAEARYVQRREGRSTLEAAARVSASIRAWSLTAGVDWRQQGGRTGPDPPDIVEAGLLANGALGRVRVRGEARWRLAPDARFDGAAIIAHWRASERADWRAELGYDHELSRARGALGYVRRFDKFALNLSAEAATDGSVAAGLNLAFSLGPDPRGGMRVTSNKLASRGTAVARVFRDLNDDGVRQPHEPAEAGVQLTAGAVHVAKLTGGDGRVVVDELQPFRPVRIGVDTSSLADPLLQPKTAALLVTPRPGVAVEIDIPLVGAGEIEGTLVRSGGGPLDGLDLELADASGRAISTARTDLDGYFLFDRVPYGDYRLRIAAASAAALGVAPILRDRIAIGPAAPSARLGNLSAARAAAATAAH